VHTWLPIYGFKCELRSKIHELSLLHIRRKIALAIPFKNEKCILTSRDSLVVTFCALRITCFVLQKQARGTSMHG